MYNVFMSAVQRALKDRPLAYYKLDDTTPFDDYSGYGRAATGTGTTTGIALANGCNYSTVFTNTATGTFASPVFLQGKESELFTLEATVLAIQPTTGSSSDQQVLSHLNTYDGLMVNGSKVAFSTRYLTAGECRVEYDLQEIQKAHIVGVHTAEKNILYVNGEQVGSTALTPEQRADSYVATNGNLYAGLTTSGQSVAVNGLGMYSTALNAQTIREHYEEAFRNVPAAFSGFLGTEIPLDYEYANVVVDRTFSTFEDWQDGLITNLDITDGLRPVVSDGVSTAGTWQNVALLESTGVTSMQEVYLDWSGTGAIVEASLDGSTWETAYRGVGLTIVPAGYNPTGKVLQIRVTLTNPTDTLTSLTVRGIGNGSYTVGTRTVTIAGEGAIRKEFNPRTLSLTSGVALRGGSLTISADTDPAAVAPRTVEVWMRRSGASAATFSSNIGSAGTFYSNGVTGTGYPAGEWVVRHFVNASGITGDIVISGNIDIGRVVVYSTVLTAAQVKKLYDSYVGVASTRLNETASIAITQPSDAAQTYAHAWQITTTG